MESIEYYLHDDPRLTPAWAPWFAHEYINYFSALALEWIMDASPVEVMPNPCFNDWAVGPDHVDIYKEQYKLVRNLDNNLVFDYEMSNGEFADRPPEGLSIDPWKILVLYPTEPDLNLDCGLDLHRLQKITGGSHGFRHMEFKAFGLTVGIARETFVYHVSASRKAFANGNKYWGWRFLSRAAHYLADLGHPFHVKAAPFSELFVRPFSLDGLFKRVSAMHQSHEVFTEMRFRQSFKPFKNALIKGAREGAASNISLLDSLPAYVKRAEKRLNPIYMNIKKVFGQKLIDVFNKMDEYQDLDASKQTMMCSAEAAGVIFDGDEGKLRFLDGVTEEILHDVGFMLGRLYEGMKLPATSYGA